MSLLLNLAGTAIVKTVEYIIKRVQRPGCGTMIVTGNYTPVACGSAWKDGQALCPKCAELARRQGRPRGRL